MQRRDCECLITAFIGVILGIVVGYIAYITLIPGIVTALWIGLGIGLGALILLTLVALLACGKKERCVCKIGRCLAIPALITIITTIIGLSITITAGVAGTAVLIGLATLFLTMTLLNIVRLILCLVDANCGCRE